MTSRSTASLPDGAWDLVHGNCCDLPGRQQVHQLLVALRLQVAHQAAHGTGNGRDRSDTAVTPARMCCCDTLKMHHRYRGLPLTEWRVWQGIQFGLQCSISRSRVSPTNRCISTVDDWTAAKVKNAVSTWLRRLEGHVEQHSPRRGVPGRYAVQAESYGSLAVTG